MRICLDLRWARPGRPDGIGTYATHLARHLVRLSTRHEWVFLLDRNGAPRDLAGWLGRDTASPYRLLDTPTRLLSLSDWRRLPGWLADEGIAIYHSPHFLVSPLRRHAYRVVVTIHDLTPLATRGFSKGEGLRWRLFFGSRWFVAQCLKRVDGFMTDCEAVRNDLASLLGVRDGVEVVPLGVEPEAEWDGESGWTVSDVQPSLPEQYLLYVGRQDPNKNLQTLLGAYAALDQGLRNRYPLILCGPICPRFQRPVQDLARRLGLEADVRFIGSVARSRLAGLYRRAALLIHPSRREGFGLTVLEAMSLGLPVVAMRIPPLEELTGGAACLIEPGRGEEEAMAGEIGRLLSDEAERARLAAAGRSRAAHYTWERCARATLGVYEQVVRKDH